MGRQTRLFVSLSTLGAAAGAIYAMPTAASAHVAVDDRAPVVAPAPPAAAPQVVIVKAGDTLSAIGASVHRTYPQLAGWNHLADPNLIMVGQVLKVPPANYVPVLSAPVLSSEYHPGRAHTPTATVPLVPSYSGGGVWACIAQHESGNTNANTGNGYYGYFQFDPRTWERITGLPGLPTAYSFSVQLAGAEKLQAVAGWGQWPATSRECGV